MCPLHMSRFMTFLVVIALPSPGSPSVSQVCVVSQGICRSASMSLIQMRRALAQVMLPVAPTVTPAFALPSDPTSAIPASPQAQPSSSRGGALVGPSDPALVRPAAASPPLSSAPAASAVGRLPVAPVSPAPVTLAPVSPAPVIVIVNFITSSPSTALPAARTTPPSPPATPPTAAPTPTTTPQAAAPGSAAPRAAAPAAASDAVSDEEVVDAIRENRTGSIGEALGVAGEKVVEKARDLKNATAPIVEEAAETADNATQSAEDAAVEAAKRIASAGEKVVPQSTLGWLFR